MILIKPSSVDHVSTIPRQPERNTGQTISNFRQKKNFEEFFFHKNSQGGSFNN